MKELEKLYLDLLPATAASYINMLNTLYVLKNGNIFEKGRITINQILEGKLIGCVLSREP